MIYPWQKIQWQQFCRQQQQQRLPHAVLITGVEGLGKLTLAHYMAASVLCESNNSGEPCQHCHSCQLFTAGSHPDHIVIEPEEGSKVIKIPQIRALKDKQELTPIVSTWKTVILTPADKMNVNANNSLLKLLEEPQQNTFIILASAKPEQLPITIRSRCQLINITSPSQPMLLDWIAQQHQVDSDVLDTISPLANGAPLAIIDMLKQGTYDTLQTINSDFELLLSRQANPVQLSKKWLNYEPALLFNYLQHLLKQKLIAFSSSSDNQSAKQYWHIYDCILTSIKLISSSNNINKTLLIEQFIVTSIDENIVHNSIVSSDI